MLMTSRVRHGVPMRHYREEASQGRICDAQTSRVFIYSARERTNLRVTRLNVVPLCVLGMRNFGFQPTGVSLVHSVLH